MYRRVVTTSAKRSFRRLPRSVREDIIKATEVLEENPLAGDKLSGPLYFLYSFHFKSDNVNYRVAYTVNHDKHLVEIHLADTRENFYLKLRRLFK